MDLKSQFIYVRTARPSKKNTRMAVGTFDLAKSQAYVWLDQHVNGALARIPNTTHYLLKLQRRRRLKYYVCHRHSTTSEMIEVINLFKRPCLSH